MTGILNTRILASVAMLVFVGAVVASSTGAFFSDTETSTGNTFTAGDIDLQIDNESYVTDASGNLVASPANSWAISDLTNQLFFSFADVKPGDIGEDTISIHAGSNDAYACMALDITGTPENTLTDPEEDANDVGPADGDNGELQNYLEFAWWADDGDNVFEVGESVGWTGRAGEIFDGSWQRLVDSTGGMLGNNPITGGSTVYIAKAWCFGELTQAPVAVGDGTPLQRGTGFTCNGAGDGDQNDAQTDGINVDVSFYAVQTRNNGSFQCANLPRFVGEGGEQRQIVGAATAAYDDPERASCNAIVGGAVSGDITHTSIQAAIDAASDSQTICVDPTYAGGDTFPVEVDKDLTIAGLGAMGDANIPGGIFISDSGVTITGLEFTYFTSGIQASANAAIYIHNEEGVSGIALTGTTIDHNIFTAPGDAKSSEAKAIITEIGSGGTIFAKSIVISHNVINGWRQGIFFNTANADVHHNDIINNDVGVANDGPHSTTIHNNDFEGNVLEAVGVAPAAIAGTSNNGLLTVNFNNFSPAGAGNNVNWYGSSVLGGADVNAKNNWWSGDVESDRTNNIAEVDTSSPEAIAFPEN